MNVLKDKIKTIIEKSNKKEKERNKLIENYIKELEKKKNCSNPNKK